MELEAGYYASPRWSWEILDCAMPMTFDTYSNCAHQCVYCFAFFQRSLGSAADDYMHHRVKAVDVEKVKRLFLLEPELLKSATMNQFAWYIKKRHVLQWGGLSDGFDWYERKFRKSLELLKFFVEQEYPVSISTKGTWFVDDPEYRAVLKGAKNVHFKYSIITTNAEHARKLEAGVSEPEERFRALEKLNELGIGATTLRFRPYMVGVSDLSVDDMFRRAHEAGVYSITTEFLCIEKRASANHLARYKAISEVVGYDVWDYYRHNSYSGSGLMRLNYEIKRPHIRHMEALAAEHNIPFYVSDAHHKEASAGAGCCGLPETGVLSNYNKGQFAEAIQIAKRNGRVYWSDIAVQAEGLKEIPFTKAEGYNQGDTFARAKNKYHTMFDFMHDIWNTPKSWSSPARYFGGALVPAGLDENQDIIYLYNEPFIKDAIRVESVAELNIMMQAQYDRRKDGGDLGHVAYPIFVVTKGRADIATTPKLLDEARLPYTLVVEPDEAAEYAAAFPQAELLVLPTEDQGLYFARQFLLDHARAEGYAYYWQMDDNLHGFFHCRNGKAEKVVARAALSGIELIVSQYKNIALAAPDYQQFAFRSKKTFTNNTRVYCCVLTSTSTAVCYQDIPCKEDVGFCLSTLAAGYDTLLVHEWAMDKAVMGTTNKGGLAEEYRAKRNEEGARMIAEIWSQCAVIKQKRRGMDVQVDWKHFRRPLRINGLLDGMVEHG